MGLGLRTDPDACADADADGTVRLDGPEACGEPAGSSEVETRGDLLPATIAVRLTDVLRLVLDGFAVGVDVTTAGKISIVAMTPLWPGLSVHIASMAPASVCPPFAVSGVKLIVNVLPTSSVAVPVWVKTVGGRVPLPVTVKGPEFGTAVLPTVIVMAPSSTPCGASTSPETFAVPCTFDAPKRLSRAVASGLSETEAVTGMFCVDWPTRWVVGPFHIIEAVISCGPSGGNEHA